MMNINDNNSVPISVKDMVPVFIVVLIIIYCIVISGGYNKKFIDDADKFIKMEIKDTNVEFHDSHRELISFQIKFVNNFKLIMKNRERQSPRSIVNNCKCPNIVYKPAGAAWILCNGTRYYLDTLYYQQLKRGD